MMTKTVKGWAVIDSPRNGEICVEKLFDETDVLCIHPQSLTKEQVEQSVPDIAQPEFNHGQVVREVTISWED